MKPEWKQFLISKGAEFDGSCLIHFGNPELENRIAPQGAVLCDLSHLGLISASGEDAKTFLQSQLSSDIQQVHAHRAQLSSYNSPKGRAYTTFHIFQRQGVYYLSCSSDVLEAVLKRLRIYVLRSKVALEDARESLVRFGYADPDGEKRLKALLGAVPEQVWDVLPIGNLTIVRHPASFPRFEIFGELDEARQLWDKLQVNAAAVSGNSWDYFDIAAGIPRITAASMEAWVPQMMNLQFIGGISFTKGCFPGQEIVARLKYLGKNKRQTYRFSQHNAALPSVGATIYDAQGEEAGQVLNAVYHPDNEVALLAVMKIAAIGGALTLNGLPLTLQALPYTLETE